METDAEKFRKLKEKYENREAMPFGEFLDKSSGMLTVFGVLNALAVFSVTLKETDETSADVLSFCFWLMSFVVWFQFFYFASAAGAERKMSLPIQIIKLASLVVLLAFARYMFLNYGEALKITIGIAIFGGSIAASGWLIGKILDVIPKKYMQGLAKRMGKYAFLPYDSHTRCCNIPCKGYNFCKHFNCLYVGQEVFPRRLIRVCIFSN